MPDLEYRTSYDFRAREDAPGIVGHSAVFWGVDSFFTAMAPGAFQNSLVQRGDKIPILYQHNPDINIGVPDTQREDERGLYLEARIFDDDGADGETLMRRLRAGARYGLSFGFRTLQDRAATEDDPLDFAQLPGINRSEVRVISEVKLYEHSIVTFPANEQADIDSVRHRAHADALRVLLDDIHDNRLTDPERALMAQIVAAFPEAPDGSAAPPSERMARRFDAEIAMARMRYLTPELIGQTA